MLYELATGRPAFSAGGFVDLIDDVLHANPPCPSRLNRSIEPDTDDR